jgi:4-amino-4-deoxy-L-arabinose transferase-like glycosyltransferase
MLLLFLLALAVRLAAWHWREFYGLGGDEREYLAQALTLLQERRYGELELMRPPLYTVFLAGSIYVVDQLIQRLRLVQALLGALTVPLIALLGREVSLASGRAEQASRDGFVAGLLAALSYTLALATTELLSETLFLAGLSLCLYLSLRAARQRSWPLAALAGLSLGLLALTRSVALPLLPLGALYLLVAAIRAHPLLPGGRGNNRNVRPRDISLPAVLVLASLLVILPWTLRNYAVYGAPILIDTTGAENLWLDNDPAGRDAVKAQLLAPDIRDDRATRQALALEQGRAAILNDPARFGVKAWGELKQFFALEHFEALRDKPAIWVPPAEVAARLILGDGIWLLLILAAAVGLWYTPAAGDRLDPRWLLVPWSLYLLVSCLLFHVEARYRLPLYPALLPYAAFALNGPAGNWCAAMGRHWLRLAGAATTILVFCTLTLAQRPYLSEGSMLARKHLRLWQAGHALREGQANKAAEHAQAALALDPRSALARVALAQAALAEDRQAVAEQHVREAIASIPEHPHAHLLLGDMLRARGQHDEARIQLGYETGSLQDLQSWSATHFPARPLSARLDIGDLDLGRIRSFQPCVEPACPLPRPAQPFRWTKAESQVLIDRPASGTLRLHLAAPRPFDAPAARLSLYLDGENLGELQPGPNWQTFEVTLHQGVAGPLWLTLHADTVRPRDFNRASPDGRRLGVQIKWIETVEE